MYMPGGYEIASERSLHSLCSLQYYHSRQDRNHLRIHQQTTDNLYIYMVKHDSVSKKADIFTICHTWKNPEGNVLNKISQTQKKILYNFIYNFRKPKIQRKNKMWL